MLRNWHAARYALESYALSACNVVRKSAADEQNLAFIKDEATWNLEV
jgi:hypothetical protein